MIKKKISILKKKKRKLILIQLKFSAEWEAILDIVNCRILSVISNDYYDAYLLSESSLFVTRNGFLLKTCGSTTLLNCLELLLKTIVKYGFDAIQV